MAAGNFIILSGCHKANAHTHTHARARAHTHTRTHKQQKPAPGTLYATACPILVGSSLDLHLLTMILPSASISEMSGE
jgi:hypothetical protein